MPLRHRFTRASLLVLLLLLPLAGCATKRDLRNLQATIQEMNAQNQTLLREIQSQQSVQADSIRAVSNFLLDLRGDMAGRFAAVENEIMILQGLQGVSQQELATLRDELEDRLSAAQPAFAPVPGGTGVAGGAGATELYQSGVTAFGGGRYAQAQLAFQEIIDSHAGDPLVPDARYYLALIHAEYDENEAAIEVLSELQEAYPSSPRAPEALYRIGMIYLDMGNPSEAIAYFTRVTESYQGSDVADLARSELQRLR